MTDYELIFIFNPKQVKKDTEAEKLAKKLVKTAEAKVKKIDSWGEKRMAYPINKHKTGRYLLLKLSLAKDKLKDLHKNIKLEDKILRHFLVRANY